MKNKNMGKDYRTLPVDALRSDLLWFLGKQYSLLDDKHQGEHFRLIEDTASDICWQLKLGYDDRLICLAAHLHDLFRWTRPNHHLLAETFVLTTTHPTLGWLTPEERRMVARACAEHRSSYKGTYTSEFSELISAAIRGRPRPIAKRLEESITYASTVKRLSGEKAELYAIAYLKKKHGKNGYARYSGIYLRAYGRELDAFRQAVDAL